VGNPLSHWYSRDGKLVTEVVGSNGSVRPPTLRDARKMGLYPSVSTITKDVMYNPAIERWQQEMLVKFAVESARQYPSARPDKLFRMCHAKLKEYVDEKAALGDKIHADIDTALSGGVVVPSVAPAVSIIKVGFGWGWTCEKSSVSGLGYAGTPDAFNDEWLIDIKSRDLTHASDPEKIAYTENVVQLSAYSHMIGKRKIANVFVDRTSAALVKYKVWSDEEADRGLEIFLSLFKLWKIIKNYDPPVF